MKRLILLITILLPLATNAQSENHIIDISEDINNTSKTIVIDSINDISHYSLVKTYRRANVVYMTKGNINMVSLSSNNIEKYRSPIAIADSIEKDFRAVNLPIRRSSEMLISSDSGYLTYATSNRNDKEWSGFRSLSYITTSPLIYIHHNRATENQLVAYFFGDGNLTVSDKGGKSMIFMITSNDGGKSWSDPKIALKHNLYSLNNASIALYSGRNNKKNELFMICSSKETSTLFLSTSSNDGMTWSYPIELPYLKDTDNHILSINKNVVSIIFTNSDKNNIDNYGDIFINITSIKDIKNQKMKGSLYKIYNYTIDQEREMFKRHRLNHTMGGILFKPRRLMFTISTPLKDNAPSTIKTSIINVSKRRSKTLN